jgi:hypothetical protein
MKKNLFMEYILFLEFCFERGERVERGELREES